MPPAEIPPDIEEFVLKYAQSVAYVEALMLLKHDPETWWESAALAKRLYITADEAGRILERICGDTFAVEQNGRYRYGCPSAELAGTIERLEKLYRNALIPLTNLIHSNRPSRVQEFANAFKLRKGK
jgi:hypothetical protein